MSLTKFFSNKEVQMAKEHMMKCSTFLAIKKILIKTMIRFCMTPVRMALIKNTRKKSFGEKVGENEPHTLLVGR
jgi:hypothetical protein